MTEDCFAQTIGHAPAFKTAASVTTVREAEVVLSEWFGAPVVLTSSGRAAILLYLGVTGHDRYRHRVAVPRMISACVLDALIRRAFPVDAATPQAADTTLLYHQYGFMQETRPRGHVLEDISHSFFASATTGARPWAGDAAVFSLQKFFPIATMIGGLVVPDADLARTVRHARDAYVEPDRKRRREHGAVHASFPGSAKTENREIVYLERLLNPRLLDEELGGMPHCVDAIRTVGSRRAQIAARILAAVPSGALPTGWSSWLGNRLPFALPLFGDREWLEKLDRALAEIGVSAGIYSIDIARNLLSPHYVSAILLPCHHELGESRLTSLLNVLRSHLRSGAIALKDAAVA